MLAVSAATLALAVLPATAQAQSCLPLPGGLPGGVLPPEVIGAGSGVAQVAFGGLYATANLSCLVPYGQASVSAQQSEAITVGQPGNGQPNASVNLTTTASAPPGQVSYPGSVQLWSAQTGGISIPIGG
jgi:hypothetical protein